MKASEKLSKILDMVNRGQSTDEYLKSLPVDELEEIQRFSRTINDVCRQYIIKKVMED